jgi:hypothetical protein
MRLNKDIKYATLIQYIWNEIISNSDFDVLKTHFFINTNVNILNDHGKQQPS